MTTDMLVLNLLAQGWPLSPKMIEDIERAWPEFLLRLDDVPESRVFGFTPTQVTVAHTGLRCLDSNFPLRANFWYDWSFDAEGDLRNTEYLILHDGRQLCIPEFPESWRG